MQTEKSIAKKLPDVQDEHENAVLLNLEKLSRKYDENKVPLYLSYPTSAWWKSKTGSETFAAKFDGDTPPFLYFHFPYCKKGCYYCMCYKHVNNDPSAYDAYIKVLEKEMSAKVGLLGARHFEHIKHMHWGGGTPTFMTCGQIEKIFNAISKKVSFDHSKNTTLSIEGYPDDAMITREKLTLLKALGFNEISYGVQDFDERVQKVINRNHKKEVVGKLIEDAKGMGLRTNVDICYGLPFQGINELERTVMDIVSMDPDRVAMFAYVHHPLLFPMQKVIPASSIPNSFLRILMAVNAEYCLESNGYRKVGHDHFVKSSHPLYTSSINGKIVRDFMGYSVEDRKQFLGFGNSAISFFSGSYFHNKTSLSAYHEDVSSGKMPLIENMGHEMTPDDVIRNEVIQQHIMCDFKIDKREISRKYNIRFDEYFQQEMDKISAYHLDDLVDLTDPGTIRINKTGEKFIRHIAYAFDGYYDPRTSTNRV